MERIKFRSSHFYHKDNSFSHFSYWGRIDHKGNFDNRCFSSPSSSSNSYIKNEEQFTGLKDKNGKDIYEGDILKWECSKSGSKKVEKYIVSIDFKFHSYSLTIYSNGEKWATGKSYWNQNDREVIGNIHENPELLNG